MDALFELEDDAPNNGALFGLLQRAIGLLGAMCEAKSPLLPYVAAKFFAGLLGHQAHLKGLGTPSPQTKKLALAADKGKASIFDVVRHIHTECPDFFQQLSALLYLCDAMESARDAWTTHKTFGSTATDFVAAIAHLSTYDMGALCIRDFEDDLLLRLKAGKEDAQPGAAIILRDPYLCTHLTGRLAKAAIQAHKVVCGAAAASAAFATAVCTLRDSGVVSQCTFDHLMILAYLTKHVDASTVFGCADWVSMTTSALCACVDGASRVPGDAIKYDLRHLTMLFACQPARARAIETCPDLAECYLVLCIRGHLHWHDLDDNMRRILLTLDLWAASSPGVVWATSGRLVREYGTIVLEAGVGLRYCPRVDEPLCRMVHDPEAIVRLLKARNMKVNEGAIPVLRRWSPARVLWVSTCMRVMHAAPGSWSPCLAVAGRRRSSRKTSRRQTAKRK